MRPIIHQVQSVSAGTQKTVLDAWNGYHAVLLYLESIKLNPEKFVFGRTSVDFAGLSINETSIMPSIDVLQAIRDFPTPQDIAGGRSLFDQVEQVAWAYYIKPEMKPFHDLVQSFKPFHYDALSMAFTVSKQHILSLIRDGVLFFEVGWPTCLATD